MPPATLRPATPDDRDLLLAIYASTRAEELAATDWSAEQKAAFCLQQFTAQDAHYRQHYPTAEYYVILAEGQPAGRMYVDHWATETRLMDLALLPEFRGRGLGTQLLQAAQQRAAAEGKRLSIHVERWNPALRLYTRLGFAPVEERGPYLLLAWSPPAS